MKRYPGLDALRLSAEAMVFACHLATYRLLVVGGAGDVLLTRLRLGVLLFFVLSGYLLYRPFVLGSVDLRSYFTARLARVLPAYWIALAGTSLLTGDLTFVHDPLRYLLFGQNFNAATFGGFLGVSWTLVLEMTFYAALPVLAGAIRRWGPIVLLALAAASFAGQLWVWTTSSDLVQMHVLASQFPFVLWCFIPGMALARFEGHPRLAWLSQPTVPLIGAGLLLLGALSPAWSTNNPVAVLGSSLLVGFAVTKADIRVPRWVGWGAAISYSAYLWHVDLMKAVAGVPAAPFVALLAVVGVASVLYLTVERPVIRFVRDRRLVHSPAVTRRPAPYLVRVLAMAGITLG